jgi:hypothetical protein
MRYVGTILSAIALLNVITIGSTSAHPGSAAKEDTDTEKKKKDAEKKRAEKAAAMAKVPGIEVTGQTVIFDAQTGNFTSKPAALDSRRPVLLLVEHVNTFREKYGLSVQTTNYFNQDMPQGLNNLFVSKPPQVLPAGATLPATGNLNKDEKIKEKLGEFNKAVEDFNKEAEKEPGITDLIDALRRAPTNEVARRNLVTTVHNSYLTKDDGNAKTVSALTDQQMKSGEKDNPEAFRTDAFITAVGTISEKIRKPSRLTSMRNEVRRLGKELQDLLSAYKAAHPDEEAVISSVNESVTVDITTTDNSYNEAKKTREQAAYLYEAVLNPSIVPTSIQLEEKLDVDEVEFRIKVTQTVFPLFQPAPAGGVGAAGVPPPPGTATPGASVVQVAVDNRLNERTYTHRASVYRRWVRDFSLGITSTDLYKRNYYVAPVAGTSPIQQGVFESNKENDGGWAPFAHYYLTTNWPFGLSLGPVIGYMPTPKARYLLGGSLVLMPARRIRVYYSYGAAYGKVERLTGSAPSNANPDPLEPTTALKRPQFEDVNRWGHFHALSFSFSF